MRTIYKAWVSDCGQYYALEAPCRQPAYDVLEVQGPGVWLSRRYEPQGWQDTDRRYTHAEFPHLTLDWTNLGGWNRTRTRYQKAFRQLFADVRQDLQLLPFLSRRADLHYAAHILATYRATFRRQRRVSRHTWEHLQARIAQALVDGHATLYPQGADHGTTHATVS